MRKLLVAACQKHSLGVARYSLNFQFTHHVVNVARHISLLILRQVSKGKG